MPSTPISITHQELHILGPLLVPVTQVLTVMLLCVYFSGYSSQTAHHCLPGLHAGHLSAGKYSYHNLCYNQLACCSAIDIWFSSVLVIRVMLNREAINVFLQILTNIFPPDLFP